ncbi:MAG: copper amine oxidase N-terminal domain-containing protein [Caldisericia bacterium]
MKDQKLSISVNTEGLRLGKTYTGNIVLSWRKVVTLKFEVTFVTPPYNIPPVITDIEVGELVNASDCQIRITTNEPCVVMVGEIEAIDPLTEPGEPESEDEDEETEDTDPIDEDSDTPQPSDETPDPIIKDPVEDVERSEYVYIATVPVEAAPSINEFEIIATDMSDNETRTSISVTNLFELIVTMQIGSNVMTVSGEEKNINPPPTVISGSTMVPVRAVSEAFGAEVEWVASTKSVIITLGDSTIILYVNSEDAMVNSVAKKVSPAPQIVSGSTMLPFRFIAEALGAEVGWDGDTKTITMTLKMEP